MQELIKVQNSKQGPVVSARDLHAFLKSKRQFADWIATRIKNYGLIEGEDFVSFHVDVKRAKGSSVRVEYALTIDTAKELAMVEGNEQGRIARRYFIERDKKLTAHEVAAPLLPMEAHAQRPVQVQNVKDVRSRQWRLGGLYATRGYFYESCLLVTGKTPAELKSWAKRKGWPSKHRTSGREVIYRARPEVACRLSVLDDLATRGIALSDAVAISEGTTAYFKAMLSLGYAPPELKQ